MNITLQNRINVIVIQHHLLNHPFYKAWTDGTLTKKHLKVYAREYGAFVSTLPLGRTMLDDVQKATAEHTHYDLWKDFADELGQENIQATLPAVKTLCTLSEKMFTHPDTSYGALYSFEKQQAETAQSKLDGLPRYGLTSEKATSYFKEHVSNHDEVVALIENIQTLSDEQQKIVCDACEKMSVAMWDALSDIYEVTEIQMVA